MRGARDGPRLWRGPDCDPNGGVRDQALPPAPSLGSGGGVDLRYRSSAATSRAIWIRSSGDPQGEPLSVRFGASKRLCGSPRLGRGRVPPVLGSGEPRIEGLSSFYG